MNTVGQVSTWRSCIILSRPLSFTFCASEGSDLSGLGSDIVNNGRLKPGHLEFGETTPSQLGAGETLAHRLYALANGCLQSTPRV